MSTRAKTDYVPGQIIIIGSDDGDASFVDLIIGIDEIHENHYFIILTKKGIIEYVKRHVYPKYSTYNSNTKCQGITESVSVNLNRAVKLINFEE